MRYSSCLFSVAFVCLASVTWADESDGLLAVPITVSNSGRTDILCQAEIAHWFAIELARIPPGESAALDLFLNERTATFSTPNAHGEALPVERAWCGIAGRTYETRHLLALDRDRPGALRLDCQATKSRLACR